jgi:glycosyltransferase involved in cell wall biosynthesis
MTQTRPSIAILGTRGIPAAHGGFETFAERLALFLVERGWQVVVYCQRDVSTVTERFTQDEWNGIERIHVAVASRGPIATLEFDGHCVRHAAALGSVCLVLGYNGAIFVPYLRIKGRKIITNMDGIEWRRAKWSLPVKAWFWVNEWIAAWASQRLVADNPVIADHLATRRSRRAIAIIPYGGQNVTSAPRAIIEAMGLDPDAYLVSIARIEPENNILTLVEAFSRRLRGARLVVLGTLDAGNAYHRAVRAAAGEEVMFPGAIYDKAKVEALRFHARAYVHGHTVGGTNPSLVEALWAGNAVIAHDNAFNRWTAGTDQMFFADAGDLDRLITRVLSDDGAVAKARTGARVRARAGFDWTEILERYEAEFLTLGGYSLSDVHVARAAAPIAAKSRA